MDLFRQGERKVVTTDLHGGCTASHTGTSASSPMAAGIIALVLEVNYSVVFFNKSLSFLKNINIKEEKKQVKYVRTHFLIKKPQISYCLKLLVSQLFVRPRGAISICVLIIELRYCNLLASTFSYFSPSMIRDM